MITSERNTAPVPKATIAAEPLLDEVCRILATGRSVAINAKGDSMLPFIAGDRDSVVLARPTVPKKGQIVLARTGGRYVLHRVVAVDGDTVTLMGDGNLQATETVRTADIAAVALAIIRRGRRVECDEPAERRRVAAWTALRPLRRYLLFLYRHLWRPLTR